MNSKTKEINKEIAKLKLFTCGRCKEQVSAVWRISITAIGISVDFCDKCKDELGDKIVEFMKGKRHYKAIAEIVQYATVSDVITAYINKEKFIDKLANYFAINSSQFDRKKFLTACGL